MGGPGSGASYYQWWRSSKKSVVEGCRSLDAIRWTRERILAAGVHHSGGWNWYVGRTTEAAASISYEVCNLDPAHAWLRLGYTVVGTGQALGYTVGLEGTPQRFGGLRWWFLCPLSVVGRPCGRRVAKLYLPRHSIYFGCRHCHKLTYTSCQESGKFRGLYRKLAADMGCDIKTVRRAMNSIGKRR